MFCPGLFVFVFVFAPVKAHFQNRYTLIVQLLTDTYAFFNFVCVIIFGKIKNEHVLDFNADNGRTVWGLVAELPDLCINAHIAFLDYYDVDYFLSYFSWFKRM